MSMHGENRRTVVAPVGEVVGSGALAALGGTWAVAKTCANAIARVIEHRRVMAQLAALDDHMLKDMGITRGDVSDAISEPLGTDPSRLLVLRATERRTARYLTLRERAGG